MPCFFSKRYFVRGAPLFLSYNGGFTLIETVVAVTLLFMAAMGPTALIVRSLADFQASRNKLIAIHLAQEGIELVRLVRDHNVICQILEPSWRWDRDSDGSGNLLGNNLRADATDWTDTATCGGVVYTNPNFSSSCDGPGNRLLMDASGRYGYVSGASTLFNRCIDISHASAAEDGGKIPASEMLEVISTITWIDHRGATRSLALQERLYHWR